MVAFALAACSNGEGQREICPKVSVVGGLDRVIAFDGAADPANAIWSAQMSQLTASCDFGRRGVAMPLEFLVLADRGQAGLETVANPEFFVAVTDASGEILVKEIYRSEIPFAENRNRMGIKEAVEPFLPYPGSRDFTGYFVLVGFQMSQEQRAFNKQFSR